MVFGPSVGGSICGSRRGCALPPHHHVQYSSHSNHQGPVPLSQSPARSFHSLMLASVGSLSFHSLMHVSIVSLSDANKSVREKCTLRSSAQCPAFIMPPAPYSLPLASLNAAGQRPGPHQVCQHSRPIIQPQVGTGCFWLCKQLKPSLSAVSHDMKSSEEGFLFPGTQFFHAEFAHARAMRASFVHCSTLCQASPSQKRIETPPDACDVPLFMCTCLTPICVPACSKNMGIDFEEAM